MDAGASRDERRDRGRPRRVVLIPRRWDQARRRVYRATEAKKPGLRGERVIGVKTIAQGMSDVSAALSLLACAKCTFLCTQGSRVRPAPGIPCALIVEGRGSDHDPGAMAPRKRGFASSWFVRDRVKPEGIFSKTGAHYF